MFDNRAKPNISNAAISDVNLNHYPLNLKVAHPIWKVISSGMN